MKFPILSHYHGFITFTKFWVWVRVEVGVEFRVTVRVEGRVGVRVRVGVTFEVRV